jgi:hypothetical protein
LSLLFSRPSLQFFGLEHWLIHCFCIPTTLELSILYPSCFSLSCQALIATLNSCLRHLLMLQSTMGHIIIVTSEVVSLIHIQSSVATQRQHQVPQTHISSEMLFVDSGSFKHPLVILCLTVTFVPFASLNSSSARKFSSGE